MAQASQLRKLSRGCGREDQRAHVQPCQCGQLSNAADQGPGLRHLAAVQPQALKAGQLPQHTLRAWRQGAAGAAKVQRREPCEAGYCLHRRFWQRPVTVAYRKHVLIIVVEGQRLQPAGAQQIQELRQAPAARHGCLPPLQLVAIVS